jgi:hypothetical protein
MQTFLPSSNFAECASILDKKRGIKTRTYIDKFLFLPNPEPLLAVLRNPHSFT